MLSKIRKAQTWCVNKLMLFACFLLDKRLNGRFHQRIRDVMKNNCSFSFLA